MVNMDPTYIPKDLLGPDCTTDRSVLIGMEKAQEELEAALRYWDKRYAWAIALARDWFPEVQTRCTNRGMDYYLIALNGKEGRDRKQKEWPMEERRFDPLVGRYRQHSINRYSEPMARMLLCIGFKAAERAWSTGTASEEGLKFILPE